LFFKDLACPARFERATYALKDVEIEAVFSKATQIIAWSELQNDSVWRQGWV